MTDTPTPRRLTEAEIARSLYRAPTQHGHGDVEFDPWCNVCRELSLLAERTQLRESLREIVTVSTRLESIIDSKTSETIRLAQALLEKK